MAVELEDRVAVPIWARSSLGQCEKTSQTSVERVVLEVCVAEGSGQMAQVGGGERGKGKHGHTARGRGGHGGKCLKERQTKSLDRRGMGEQTKADLLAHINHTRLFDTLKQGALDRLVSSSHAAQECSMRSGRWFARVPIRPCDHSHTKGLLSEIRGIVDAEADAFFAERELESAKHLPAVAPLREHILK
jgi:hypothetical protein